MESTCSRDVSKKLENFDMFCLNVDTVNSFLAMSFGPEQHGLKKQNRENEEAQI